ncbi:MAG: serine/threonine-protein kinase [Polyangiaceae bacterium]
MIEIGSRTHGHNSYARALFGEPHRDASKRRAERNAKYLDLDRDLEITRCIAWGSRSQVYEAVRRRDMRRFAIKLLVAEGLDVRIRFELEGRALSRIRHPHVVEILSAVTTPNGAKCIVMPFLVGDTLRALLDTTGRLSQRRAATLMVNAAAGLHASHSAGVLHRDLNPRNVFIGQTGDELPSSARPILIDFGLAKLEPTATELSARFPAFGNPAYMAPEQILGAPTDARTDVYGLGILLFEALAGRPPFVSDDADEVTHAQLDRTAPALDRTAGTSAAVARVAARALEKHPRDRYPSARAFAEALHAAV